MGIEIIALVLGIIALVQCVYIRRLKKEINRRDDEWLSNRYYKSVTFIPSEPQERKESENDVE